MNRSAGVDRPPGWTSGAARIETDQDGQVVAWDEAAERLYGYSPREAIGRPIAQLVVPARGREQAEEIMRTLALGHSWEGEFSVRRRDRRVMRVHVHNAPVFDADGEIAGVVGYSTPTVTPPRAQAAGPPGSPRGALRRAFSAAMVDPSLAVGPRMRAQLIASGAALELAWALLARAIGREESVGVSGAVAIIGVLAIAIADVPAGVAVALIGGVIFNVVVSYAQPPDPFAFGLPLIAVWTLSALAGGAAAVRLRAQAQRGVSEAVALHRELVGSLVPTPRLRRADVSVASVYRPGEQRLELGGDFYAAIERADGGIALLVGDVSGHGAAAAGLAAMLRAGWEALVEAGVTPSARLQSLNRLLLAHASYEEFFATVCSVVIDPSLTTATFALAGHPAPMLMSAGAPVRFDVPTGAPLGISEGATWTPATVTLPRPFSLLLYTDGVIEGRAAPGASERFGEERLRDVVCGSTAGGRELLGQVLLAASGSHGGPLPDDAALLLLEHSGRSRPPGDARQG